MNFRPKSALPGAKWQRFQTLVLSAFLSKTPHIFNILDLSRNGIFIRRGTPVRSSRFGGAKYFDRLAHASENFKHWDCACRNDERLFQPSNCLRLPGTYANAYSGSLDVARVVIRGELYNGQFKNRTYFPKTYWFDRKIKLNFILNEMYFRTRIFGVTPCVVGKFLTSARSHSVAIPTKKWWNWLSIENKCFLAPRPAHFKFIIFS